MKLRVKSAKTVTGLSGAIFLVIGLVFFIAGCVLLVSNRTFMNTAETAKAEIISIETERVRSNGKNKVNHYVYVRFETKDGEVIEGKLNEYNSGMREGKKIDVWYDPDDHSDFRTGSYIMEMIFMLVGGIFAVIGAVFLICIIRSARRRKQLIQNGDRLTGRITDVIINNRMKVNGRHPYKAECEVINPFDGEKYLYSSENITEDISWLTGMDVTVYVDRNDKRKYYMDIQELMNSYRTDNKIHDYR